MKFNECSIHVNQNYVLLEQMLVHGQAVLLTVAGL